MKKIVLLLLIICPVASVQCQNDTRFWSAKVYSDSGDILQFVHAQINSGANSYIFMSDSEGRLAIDLRSYTETDTIILTCIGYENSIFTIADLSNCKRINMVSATYEAGEVIVIPQQKQRIRLGNLRNSTYYSSQLGFGGQKALYIPNNDSTKGFISEVQVYMHDFSQSNWKYRPFRIRIYNGDTLVGHELTKGEIIASLGSKKGRWVCVDLSLLGIEFPEDGIYLSVQALPYEYYFENGIINSRIIKGKQTNSFSIGATKRGRRTVGVVSWDKANEISGWRQHRHGYFYLLRVVIESF